MAAEGFASDNEYQSRSGQLGDAQLLSTSLNPPCAPPRPSPQFFHLSRRRYISPNFAELRHILNIAQVGAADVNLIANKAAHAPGNSAWQQWMAP